MQSKQAVSASPCVGLDYETNNEEFANFAEMVVAKRFLFLYIRLNVLYFTSCHRRWGALPVPVCGQFC